MPNITLTTHYDWDKKVNKTLSTKCYPALSIEHISTAIAALYKHQDKSWSY
jgi:Zn-dependent membrane protease YugP